jgi:vacuolar-type H+-ATPase subunit I/STV1
MKQAFLRLPGPIPVKIVLAVVIVIVALFLLNIIYSWMGNFLDSGGTIS